MDEDALRGLDPRADPQLQRRVMLPLKFSKSTCIPIIFQKKDTCYPFDAFASLICDLIPFLNIWKTLSDINYVWVLIKKIWI